MRNGKGKNAKNGREGERRDRRKKIKRRWEEEKRTREGFRVRGKENMSEEEEKNAREKYRK